MTESYLEVLFDGLHEAFPETFPEVCFKSFLKIYSTASVDPNNHSLFSKNKKLLSFDIAHELKSKKMGVWLW